ncbi:MAG: ChbG/HpnK family deacetylase [Acidobacteria bacterium]|nr:ChbG/HpnK family deacetylase [Acidobacteriota bacterium]
MSLRRLIVNADDFGFTRDVNRGIVEACERGILRATTLMANGDAFDDAVEQAARTPSLDVGCHLTLVGGRSVADPGKSLPGSVGELLPGLLGRWSLAALEEELSAQVEKIRAAGLRPSHVDTHKHTHLAPPVLDAVLAVAKRYGIAWVRRPFDLPLTAAAAGAPWKRRVVSRLLGGLNGRFERKLAAAGRRSTDHFAGFQITGLFRAAEIAALLRALPEGLTELMTHPGFCTAELNAAPTRLRQSRQIELEALTSPVALRAAEEAGVEITSYAALEPAR